MAKINKVVRCYHCGAVLQSSNKKNPGYVDNSYIDENQNKFPIIYCKDCYEKLIEINKNNLNLDDDKEILKILNDAVASDALIIWVLDLYTFNGTLNKEITKKIRNLNLIVIGTKKDLFPKRVRDTKLLNYLKLSFENSGLNPISYILCGNETTLDTNKLIKDLHSMRKGHDVYMIGNQGSGKTAFIEKMLKTYKNKSNRVINSIQIKNSTKKMLEIPLSNSSFLYEVPGFCDNSSIYSKVEKSLLKIIVPKNKTLPMNRILNKGECITFGSLGAFELYKGRSTPIKIYTSKTIETHKTLSNKLFNFFEINNVKRYFRPVSDRYISFNDYDVFDVIMENDNKYHDIYINGLCWISFIAKGQIIRVTVPKGVLIVESIGKVD